MKNKIPRDYLASIGAKGGKSTSPAKQAASRANGARNIRKKPQKS